MVCAQKKSQIPSSIIGEVNKTVFFFSQNILNLKTHKTIASN